MLREASPHAGGMPALYPGISMPGVSKPTLVAHAGGMTAPLVFKTRKSCRKISQLSAQNIMAMHFVRTNLL
jgi:hypothetical protein